MLHYDSKNPTFSFTQLGKDILTKASRIADKFPHSKMKKQNTIKSINTDTILLIKNNT